MNNSNRYINFDQGQIIGKRDEQQDTISNLEINNGYRLHILADGMGGHRGGRVASDIVAKAFAVYFEEKQITNPEYCLKEALNYANQEVANMVRDNPELKGMGTTVIALLYNTKINQYSFLSVGDSPLYKFKGNKLLRINDEHTHYQQLQKLVKSGLISQQDADSDPQRHAVTSAVIGGAINEIDVRTDTLWEGEYLLMASDGVQSLSDTADGEISQIFQRNDNLDEITDAILEGVQEKNYDSQDNTSIIVIKHLAEPKEDEITQPKKSKGLIKALMVIISIIICILVCTLLYMKLVHNDKPKPQPKPNPPKEESKTSSKDNKDTSLVKIIKLPKETKKYKYSIQGKTNTLKLNLKEFKDTKQILIRYVDADESYLIEYKKKTDKAIKSGFGNYEGHNKQKQEIVIKIKNNSVKDNYFCVQEVSNDDKKKYIKFGTSDKKCGGV